MSSVKVKRRQVVVGAICAVLAATVGSTVIWAKIWFGDERPCIEPITKGMHEDELMSLVEAEQFALVGVFDRHGDEATWTLHHTQGDPIRTPVSPGQEQGNTFWEDSGWQYPTAPIPDKAIVLYPRNSDIRCIGLRIYAYLDRDGRVAAIHTGNS